MFPIRSKVNWMQRISIIKQLENKDKNIWKCKEKFFKIKLLNKQNRNKKDRLWKQKSKRKLFDKI